MKNNKFIALLLIASVLFVAKAKAQDDGITLKGYIISLGGELFFSPRKDSIYVLKTLNELGFSIGGIDDRNDQIESSLDGVGDSLMVDVVDQDGNQYYVRMSYFYCKVKFVFAASNQSDLAVYDKPIRQVIYKRKKYPFSSIWIRNRFADLVPSRKQDLEKIKNYYDSRNFNYPVWLKK